MTPSPNLTPAETIALDRLVRIARDSECEHEARLAAEAIFNLRKVCRLSEPTADSTRPTAPAATKAQSPLTMEELSELATLLPSVKPQRFLNKHTPAHWRDTLHRLRQSATTGPPRQAA